MADAMSLLTADAASDALSAAIFELITSAILVS
jgi:hypothetical protein